MKNIKYKLIITLLLLVIILPGKIFAAKITASSTDIVSAGDTSMVNIYLDTQGQQINSIDGSIILRDESGGNFEVKDLSVANSVFNMWPGRPSLEDGHKIKFVGGIVGGVNGDHLLIFKIIVKINQPGNFSVIPDVITAYLNDGIPTKVNVTEDISKISVGVKKDQAQDKWEEIISNDNIAPNRFEIKLIKDPYLYDGKKFIIFETTDAQSGIDYYEVKEGNREGVRSGTNYVLIDQNKNEKITVTAYDKANNFQVATINTREKIKWGSIAITLIILSIFYKIFKRWKKKRKQKNAL